VLPLNEVPITVLPENFRSSSAADRILSELDASVNEVFLFHGTTPSGAKHIIENGFDMALSKDSNKFGLGAYFSENFCKANQYSVIPEEDSTEEKHVMLLCRCVMNAMLLLQ
jgi:hypothetical protein